MTLHRRAALLAAATLLPVLGSGCASMADMARVFIGVDELAAMIQRQFPRQQRVYDSVDVLLSLPKLRLVPQRNRLATQLQVAATERIFGRKASGTLGLEYGLRYEAKDASVRLKDVQVESLQLDGASGSNLALQSISQTLIERLLDDMVVVKLSTQRAEALRQLSLNTAAMTVTDRGLDIRFASSAR